MRQIWTPLRSSSFEGEDKKVNFFEKKVHPHRENPGYAYA